MTMETLAIRSGVNYHDLSRIERGVITLSPRTAGLLGGVLGVEPARLLRAHEALRSSLSESAP